MSAFSARTRCWRTSPVRRLLLLAVSVAALILLSRLPDCREWVDTLISYYRQVPRHLTTSNLDQRMYDRLGRNFMISQQLRDIFLRPGDVFLLPPVEYVRRRFDDVHCGWAEPKFFYYMVGRQETVTLASQDLRRATCTIMFDQERKPGFVRFETHQDLERAIELFSGGLR